MKQYDQKVNWEKRGVFGLHIALLFITEGVVPGFKDPQEDHHGATLPNAKARFCLLISGGPLPYSLTQKMEEEGPCLFL